MSVTAGKFKSFMSSGIPGAQLCKSFISSGIPGAQLYNFRLHI